MINFALAAAERGLLPDSVIRYGVRQLLKERAASLNSEISKKFEDSLSSSPIALLTELANEQHYEVPASYFEKVLGRFRKYSSGLWERASSLEESEAEMLELYLKRLEISEEMRVLDLGCGWGSFTLFAAERFPLCKFTAVSNSRSQRESILSECHRRGLRNVEVITADMNSFQAPTQFDRIVSIEMFEHLRNYELAFQRVASWLKDDGKFFLHIFTHRQFSYPFETEGADNWMGRHFFSGGMMPAHTLPERFNRDLKADSVWKISGKHYAKTCEAWLKQHDALRREIIPIFSELYGADAGKWFHRWRLFYIACAELFAFSDGDEWFVSHYLFSKVKSDA